jgi:hypothetical protein
MQQTLSQAWEAFHLIGVLVFLALLESWSRLLSACDYYLMGNRHEIWDIAWTTKEVDRMQFDQRQRAQWQEPPHVERSWESEQV